MASLHASQDEFLSGIKGLKHRFEYVYPILIPVNDIYNELYHLYARGSTECTLEERFNFYIKHVLNSYEEVGSISTERSISTEHIEDILRRAEDYSHLLYNDPSQQDTKEKSEVVLINIKRS